MAQTHPDADCRPTAKEFMEKLEARANEMQAKLQSKITGGTDGEPVLAHWSASGVDVKQRPDDPQGILRISIGGGVDIVPLNYLVFRGDHGKCVDLLRKALAALEAGGADGN